MNESGHNLAIILVVGINMLLVVPLFFMEGNPFVKTNGIYYDNVYNIILHALMTTTCLMIPFSFSKLSFFIKAVSMVMGSWLSAGLFFELANLSIPNEVLNNPYDFQDSSRWAISSFVLIIFSYTSWIHYLTRKRSNF